MGKETRPAFVLDDVKEVELRNVKAQKAPGTSLFVLKNVQGFLLKDSKQLSDKFIKSTSGVAW